MAKQKKAEAQETATAKKAWYFRWNEINGTLQRVSNLPKYKDGYDYFRVDLDADGRPSGAGMLTEDDFDGTVEKRLNEQNKKQRLLKEEQARATADKTGNSNVVVEPIISDEEK